MSTALDIRRSAYGSSQVTKVGNFAEVGSTGLSRFGGNVYDEFLPALRWPKYIKVYKEMSYNDPVVGAIMFAAKQLIRKTSWRVEAVGNDKVDIAAKEFIDQCRTDMGMTWSDMISEILSMLVYGWSYHEIVYKKRNGYNRDLNKNSEFNDGRIGWSKIQGRAQETLHEWNFADNGDVESMVQVAPPDFRTRVIPFEKSLLFRTEADKNSPEGRSLLRNAYRPWYFKKRIEEIEGIGIERDLAGLPVLIPPENVNIWNTRDTEMVRLKGVAEKLVRNIRRDQNEGIVLPYGWELKLLSSSSKRQFDTNAIINRYDQRIAICMLADVIMMGAEKVGSYALSEVKKGLFASGLETFLDSIQDVFNKYAIPRLIQINAFPGLTRFPKLIHGEVESPDLRELARYIDVLANRGIPILNERTIDQLKEVASLPTGKGTNVNEFEPPVNTNPFQQKSKPAQVDEEEDEDDTGKK